MNEQTKITEAAAFDPAAHGWQIVNNTAFGELIGPIWHRRDGDKMLFGIQVAPKHLNRAGNLHGGMLMSLADQSMAITARDATGSKRHATIELNTQFVGSVKPGEFVEARPEVVRPTRSVVFMAVKMFVGDRIVASANGIWKILDQP
jgi:uncharacterized protein (TIGR00369 family)